MAATVSQAGAGILNLAAAVGGTVAANPTALNFGTGTSVSKTVQLTLYNVGQATDTYTLQVVPANGTAPTVATGSVSLAPGASQQVAVSLAASGLAAGEYSGTVQVTGTASGTVATVPYWFAAPGSQPAGISVLYQDYYDNARSSSSQAVVFRVVDAAGLPYTGTLRPSLTVAGSGTATRPYTAGDIPGTYAVDIRTGTTSMQLTFTAGTATATVIIPVI